jgi:tRNA(Ile)-lysidine synthase
MGNNLQRVSRFIDQQQLLHRGDSVIVALSGGSDSVALLLMLCRLGYHCIAAHCNFHLRGEESDRDETFVTDLCHRQQVNLEITHFDTRKYALDHHLSIEMAARELRYDWFEQLYAKYDVAAIAVAHHRDDSIETILLNLIRGTGINGLCGIRPHNGHVVRPLLCLSRKDIIDYLNYCGQSFVTDSTNLQDEYTRNKIRLRLLPLMEEINPSVRDTLQQTAEYLYGASLVYNKGIAEGKERVMKGNNISIQALMNEPSPKSLLFELLHPLGFNSAQVGGVFDAISGQAGKQFKSENYLLVKDRDLLLISERHSCNFVEKAPFELSYEEQAYTASFKIPRDAEAACFDADKLAGPFTLRKWERGDKFVPFGMKGKKLVSDFLTDCKRSVIQKDEQWVLCSGDTIVWIVGLRTDNRFRVDSTTQRVLIVRIAKK